MSLASDRELSQEGRKIVFLIATRSLLHFHADAMKIGMSDEALQEALKDSLGIFGGSGGPNTLSVSFAGSGLRIWGGWQVVNHVQEAPLFSGKKTIAMAREVYRIKDSDDDQLVLF